MKDLVTYLVKAVVDNEEAVEVTQTSPAPNSINVEISVAPEDMGKVIGKEGKIIKSIRNLVRVLAVKTNTHFNLSIKE